MLAIQINIILKEYIVITVWYFFLIYPILIFIQHMYF